MSEKMSILCDHGRPPAAWPHTNNCKEFFFQCHQNHLNQQMHTGTLYRTIDIYATSMAHSFKNTELHNNGVKLKINGTEERQENVTPTSVICWYDLSYVNQPQEL